MALTQRLASDTPASVALAASCALVAVSVWPARTTRPGVVLAIGVSLGLSATQNLGGLLSGSATDPSTGPLLVLLAACFWSPRAARRSNPRPGAASPSGYRYRDSNCPSRRR